MTSTTTWRGGWYYGRNIVAVCMLSQVAALGVPFNCLSLFLHQWSSEFHVPISQILLATVLMVILMAAASAVVGSLADRRPARWLMGIGLAGIALVTLIGSMAKAAWQIEALYALLLPVFLVMCTSIVCNPLVSRWFAKRLGLAIGITSFGMGLGGVILPPLVAEVIPLIGWRAVWRISAAVVVFVVLPIVILVVRDRPTERDRLQDAGVEDAAGPVRSHGHGGPGGDLRTRDVLKRKNFWFVLAVFVPVICVYIGGQSNIAPLALSRGFGQAMAGLLLSVANLSSVASTLIVGLLADRFGNRLPLLILAAAAGASGLFLGLGHGLAPLAAGCALMGFGGGIMKTLSTAATAEFGAANTGRVFGLFNVIIPLGALMSAVIAWVKEVAGSYSPVFITLSALCLIGGAIVLFMRERRHGHPNPKAMDQMKTGEFTL